MRWRRMVRMDVVTVLVACVAARPSWGAEVPACWPTGSGVVDPRAYVRGEANEETRRLVGELGSVEFGVRDRAFKELLGKGVDGFPGIVQAARESGNEEVRVRVERVVGNLDMQAAAAAHRAQTQTRHEAGARIVMGLKDVPALAGGGFQLPRLEALTESTFTSLDEHARFYEKLALENRRPELVNALRETLNEMAPVRARLALLEGRPADAEVILRAALMSGHAARSDYVALALQLRGKNLDAEKELDATRLGDGEERSDLGMMFYRAKGDRGKALEFAGALRRERYGDPPMMVEARGYAEIATYLERQSLDPFSGGRLTALMLAGKQAEADALANKWKVQFVPVTDTAAIGYALMQGGRPKEALEVVTRRQDERDASFHILSEQLRVREALAQIKDRQCARIETANHLMDLGLMVAARALLRDIQPDAQPPGQKGTATKCLEYADAWERTGDTTQAAKWRKAAFALVDANSAKLEPLLQSLRQLNKQLESPKNIDGAVQKALLAQRTALLAQIRVIRQQPEVAKFSWRQAVPRSENWDAVSFWGARAVDEEGTEEEQILQARRRARGEVSASEAFWMMEAATNEGYRPALVIAMETFHRGKHDEWAFEMAVMWEAHHQDPAGWAFMGDIALEKGQPEMAFVYYRRAAVKNLTNASLMYRTGLALSHAGRDPTMGKEAMAFAMVLVMGDQDQANQVGEAMRKFEEKETRDRWLDAWWPALGYVNLFEAKECFGRRRDAAEARGDLKEAVACQGQVLMEQGLLQSPVNRPEREWEFMKEMAAYQRLRALEGMGRGDVKVVGEAVRMGLWYGPPDVGLLEKVVPWLKGKDEGAAREVLGEAEGRLGAVVEDYPGEREWRSKWERVKGLGEGN